MCFKGLLPLQSMKCDHSGSGLAKCSPVQNVKKNNNQYGSLEISRRAGSDSGVNRRLYIT